MEIVVITGVLAVAALALMTLRMRASRGSARKVRGTRQWNGRAGSRRVRAGRNAVVPAAAGAGGAVAYSSIGGGVAVQDPPRTGEADLDDDWDDDLGWSDDLEAREAPAPAAPVAFGAPPATAEPASRD